MFSDVSVDGLRMKGVPYSLCDLIRNMIDCVNGDFMGNDSYSDLVDVTCDLQLMLDKPLVYLHDLDVGKLLLTGLDLNNTVFEQNDEFASLQSAYLRALSGSSELAIITGMSGTGKSTVANRFGNFVTANGGMFLSGKFDQMMQQVQPFSAFASAFNNYCSLLTRDEQTERAKLIACQLQEVLGSDVYYLIQVIPNLSQIIYKRYTKIAPNQDDCVDAKERLHYLFSRFAEIISSCSGGPMTLFLDDVQWADSASISIIGQLLKNSRSRDDGVPFFFLGCCRDDEIGSGHSFWQMIDAVSTFGFKTTLVKLNCMDKDSVTKVVSNLLHLSPRLVGSLSDIVYHKTKGNHLFVSRMLLSLNREGLLRLSLSRHRWEWDEEKIQSRKLPDDVAAFFVQSINTLPIDVKIALVALSCFGASTECEIIHAIEADLNLKLIEPLNIAIAEGLLSKLDGRYRFCHDRIHQATYSIIDGEFF
jgi:predicted ATPase